MALYMNCEIHVSVLNFMSKLKNLFVVKSIVEPRPESESQYNRINKCGAIYSVRYLDLCL